MENTANTESNTRHRKNGLTEGNLRLQGIVNTLSNVEEITLRNSTQLHSVLEMVEILSSKVEKISTLAYTYPANKTNSTTTLPNTACVRNTPGTPDKSLQPDLDKPPMCNIICDGDRFVDNFSNNHDTLKESYNGLQSVNPSEPSTVDIDINMKTNLQKRKGGINRANTFGRLLKCRIAEEVHDNRITFDHRSSRNCIKDTVDSLEESNIPISRMSNLTKNNRSFFGSQDETSAQHNITPYPINDRDHSYQQNVNTMEEWINITNQIHKEDVSESMRGESFVQMIATAKEYIDGLQTMSLMHNIRDNVGVASFGGETKLILPPLTDYGDIKMELEKLKPYGPSPLAAGLMLAFAGCMCDETNVNGYALKPIIVLMTDGAFTRVEALTEQNNRLFMETALRTELETAVSYIVSKGIKIYCIPFGYGNTDVIKMMVSKSNGQILPRDQISRLYRMTQTLLRASVIAKQLDEVQVVNKRTLKMFLISDGVDDSDDDIIDQVLLLIDPKTKYPGCFEQTKWPAVKLGTRVRRGSDLKGKNPDPSMLGTVIGSRKNGMVVVEWDNGHKQSYNYDEETNVFDIMPVNIPRRLVDDMIAVGCRVKRGINWNFGNQDGGKGFKGTVLRVEDTGKVVVQWDKGRLAIYNFGEDDLFEVEISEQDRTSVLGQLIVDDNNWETEDTISTYDSPLILPMQRSKQPKTVTAIWQYETSDGQWTCYDDEINAKIERAYNRNPQGKCIVEINKTISVVQFKRMVQENPRDKSIVPVQRLDQKITKPNQF